ncbi:hypothetical protein LCGC14_1245640 [marine sediment metagenome]|uniref:Uncharacterized protein n=1 Tax=marine sediment metagenome TaxID=412755 RepID=A0A0F9P8G7_9ZZZZ
MQDRAPEDILREEQEREMRGEMPGTLGEQAQQEADHLRDVQNDREMVTDEPTRPTLGLPYVRGVEEHRVLNYSYWNANGVGIAIVAVEGGAADWAAYIGGDDGQRTEDCVAWTIRRGCKLSRQQAHRWFPDIPIEAYRE